MPLGARFLPLLLAAAVAAAQAGLSYSQLRQFVKSSVEQKLKDRDVAAYLKRQAVGFQISDRLIEEFVGWGIGPADAEGARRPAVFCRGPAGASPRGTRRRA